MSVLNGCQHFILLLLGSLEMKQSFLIVKMSAFVFISINMCPWRFLFWKISFNIWKNFAICELMTSIVQQNCQIIERSATETWGRGWVVVVVNTKWRNISLVSRGRNIRAIGWTNIARTARRQLDGRHLQFGECFQNWTTLYLLNLLINMNYRRWTEHR